MAVKQKNLATQIAEKFKKDRKFLGQLPAVLKKIPDVQKGVCLEALEFATEEKPELAAPYVGMVVDYLDHKAPKVKWEASRVIANVAKKFPDDAAKAVPKLLANSKDKGTVVRWSAALALGEIAKNSEKARKTLMPKINEILKTEKNSGVRNVYLKAMKEMEKGRK